MPVVLIVLFGGLFIVVKIVVLVVSLGADHVVGARAAFLWPEVQGTVIDAQVVAPRTRSARMIRAMKVPVHRRVPAIRVAYTVAGTTYETTSIAGYGMPFRWRPEPAELVAQHPVGTSVRVRHHPVRPELGLLEPGPVGWRLVECLIYLPLLASVVLVVLEIRNRRRITRDPIGSHLLNPGEPSPRIRMASSTPMRWATASVALGTVGAFVALFSSHGRTPPASAIGLAAAMVCIVGAIAGILRWRRNAAPESELVVDHDGRVIQLPRGSVRQALADETGVDVDEWRRLPFDRIVGVDWLTVGDQSGAKGADGSEAKAEENGGPHVYIRVRPATIGGGVESVVELPSVAHGKAWLPALAAWLRSQIGVPEPEAAS